MADDVPASALAVYAHPDDAEVSAGGTLARWVDAGATVWVLITARGDKGTDDPDADLEALAAQRVEETARAVAALGFAGHTHLGNPDGELPDDQHLRAAIVRTVRELRPEVVCCPDPTAVFFGQRYANHRDHRSVGWSVLDAVTPAAGNPHYFPDAGPAHEPAVLYLSGTLEPDVWVDITDTIDTKAAALACHATQVEQPGEWLRSVVRQRAEAGGRQAGVRYAEGFRRLVLGG